VSERANCDETRETVGLFPRFFRSFPGALSSSVDSSFSAPNCDNRSAGFARPLQASLPPGRSWLSRRRRCPRAVTASRSQPASFLAGARVQLAVTRRRSNVFPSYRRNERAPNLLPRKSYGQECNAQHALGSAGSPPHARSPQAINFLKAFRVKKTLLRSCTAILTFQPHEQGTLFKKYHPFWPLFAARSPRRD